MYFFKTHYMPYEVIHHASRGMTINNDIIITL